MADETAVDKAAAEVGAALAALAPIIEGDQDYKRLNLERPAAEAIVKSFADYNALNTQLNQAKDALSALQANPDYPVPRVRTVPRDAYDDLVNQRTTIEAALAQFEPVKPATELGLTAGEPEPK